MTHLVLVDMSETRYRLQARRGDESRLWFLLPFDVLELDLLRVVPAADRIPGYYAGTSSRRLDIPHISASPSLKSLAALVQILGRTLFARYRV